MFSPVSYFRRLMSLGSRQDANMDDVEQQRQSTRGWPKSQREFWAQLLRDEQPEASILDRARYREQRWTLFILRLRALSLVVGFIACLPCIVALANTWPPRTEAFAFGFAPPLCCAAWDYMELRKRRQTRNIDTFILSTLVGMEFVQFTILGISIGFFCEVSVSGASFTEGIVLLTMLSFLGVLRATILITVLLHNADRNEERRVAEMLEKNGSAVYNKTDETSKDSLDKREEQESQQQQQRHQQRQPRQLPSSRPPSCEIDPDIDINQKFMIPFDLIRDDAKVRGLAPQGNSKFAAPPTTGGRTRSASF